MAVNTAYVASSELLERVAHRYNFEWLAATNRRDSLYRIHILNGAALHGDHPAHGRARRRSSPRCTPSACWRASCINIGCLLIYRYFRGTKEIAHYYTSRVRHAAARAAPRRVLRLPRRSQAVRHRALGRGGGASSSPPASRCRAATARRCRRSGAATTRWRCCSRWPRSTVRCTSSSAVPARPIMHGRPGNGVRHLLLAAPGDARIGWRRTTTASRSRAAASTRSIVGDPRAARGGVRRPRRHDPPRLADCRRGSTAWRRASSSPTSCGCLATTRACGS